MLITKDFQEINDYIKFLKAKKIKIFYTENKIPWTKYQKCIQPAMAVPYELPKSTFVNIKQLIKKSKSFLARWTSDFTEKHTEWYWIVCESPFILKSLSHNVKNQIKKGLKNCEVKIINPIWLSDNGYNIYKIANTQRKQKTFVSKNQWKNDIRFSTNCKSSEFWGIFINNKLIGYCRCNIINNMISIASIYHDRNYLKYYPIYSLLYTMLNCYLNKRMYYSISNGMLSINHHTNMQGFLKKFGFKEQFCRLNIIYSPFFGFLVKIIYPFSGLINYIYKIISSDILYKIIVILRQEKIRRSFL